MAKPMRVLCLHGSGTNAEIFKAQTAAIRHELGGGQTFEFVQGTEPWPLAAGLESMYPPSAEYYSYFDWYSLPSCASALAQLDKYIATEGPFDAVLGFSNGAGLAVMYMCQKAMQDRHAEPPFKCAVLMNCIWVFDPIATFKHGQVKKLRSQDHGELIRIPVANIWGAKDDHRTESEEISDLCQASLKSVFVHEGGHEIPGLGVQAGITPAVKAIRRAFTQAKLQKREKRRY